MKRFHFLPPPPGFSLLTKGIIAEVTPDFGEAVPGFGLDNVMEAPCSTRENSELQLLGANRILDVAAEVEKGSRFI